MLGPRHAISRTGESVPPLTGAHPETSDHLKRRDIHARSIPPDFPSHEAEARMAPSLGPHPSDEERRRSPRGVARFVWGPEASSGSVADGSPS